MGSIPAGGAKAQPKSLVKSRFFGFFIFTQRQWKQKNQEILLANSPSANGQDGRLPC